MMKWRKKNHQKDLQDIDLVKKFWRTFFPELLE